MGARGVGVAHAVDDGDAALVVEGLDGAHLGMEADLVIQGQDALFRDADHGAILPVEGVGVRDDSVQVVVAAGHLQDNEDRVFVGLGHCSLSSVS